MSLDYEESRRTAPKPVTPSPAPIPDLGYDVSEAYKTGSIPVTVPDLSGSDQADAIRSKRQTTESPVVFTPSDPQIALADKKVLAEEKSHQTMTPTEEILVDAIYQDVALEKPAEAGRDLSKDLLSRSRDLRDQGNPLGVGLAIAGNTARFGVGVYEGVTFVLRPNQWVGTGRTVVGLGQDLGAYLGTGVPASGVSGAMRDSIASDPLGFSMEFAGNIAGGYLLGKGISKIKGEKAFNERVSGVEVKTRTSPLEVRSVEVGDFKISEGSPNVKGADFTFSVDKKPINAKVAKFIKANEIGGETKFTGLVGTTEDPLGSFTSSREVGVKLNLPSGDLERAFKPKTDLLSRAKRSLGFERSGYQSETFFSGEGSAEFYNPTAESKVLMAEKTSDPLRYKPGYEVPTNKRVSGLTEGRVGGVKDFKEIGPGAPDFGGSQFYSEGTFKGPIGPGPEGLTDTTKIKVIAGITEENPNLLGEASVKPVKPEPGPKTAWRTLPDSVKPSISNQAKSVGDVKDYLGRRSEPGLGSYKLVEKNVLNTRSLERIVYNPGVSEGTAVGAGLGVGAVSTINVGSIGLQDRSPGIREKPSEISKPLTDSWMRPVGRSEIFGLDDSRVRSETLPDVTGKLDVFSESKDVFQGSNLDTFSKSKTDTFTDSKKKTEFLTDHKVITDTFIDNRQVLDNRHKDDFETVQWNRHIQDPDTIITPIPVFLPDYRIKPLYSTTTLTKSRRSKSKKGLAGLERRKYKIKSPLEMSKALFGSKKRRSII